MTDNEELERFKISPEQARHRLNVMGFTDDMWDKIMSNGFDGDTFGSHETQALITIARGSERRLLGEVYREMRKRSGLSAERK